MTIKQIQDVARAEKFQPFSLETVGGNRITVDHPDYIFFVPNGLTVIIYSKAQDTVELVNAEDVASIRVTTPLNTR